MPLPRFIPALDVPDDASGSLTVVVGQDKVIVLDDHPDALAADLPACSSDFSTGPPAGPSTSTAMECPTW